MTAECEKQINNFMWGKLCNQGEKLCGYMQSCHNLKLYGQCPSTKGGEHR